MFWGFSFPVPHGGVLTSQLVFTLQLPLGLEPLSHSVFPGFRARGCGVLPDEPSAQAQHRQGASGETETNTTLTHHGAERKPLVFFSIAALQLGAWTVRLAFAHHGGRRCWRGNRPAGAGGRGQTPSNTSCDLYGAALRRASERSW